MARVQIPASMPYRKIPKIRPFLWGLFFFFGGVYVRREICVSKSIGLACSGKKFTIFALFYFVFEGKFQVQAPRGAYISRGDLTEGFFAFRFWGAYIWRGLYIEGLIFGILRCVEFVVSSLPCS